MQVTCPTFAPHPAPHALVVRVEPGEQPQLVGWVDVAGKGRRVEWRGFLQLRGCEGVLRAAPRHATQHQHLGRPWGQRTFHKRARHERSSSHLEYLQQHVSPRALAERLIVHAAIIRAALVRVWLCEWYNGTTFQYGWRRRTNRLRKWDWASVPAESTTVWTLARRAGTPVGCALARLPAPWGITQKNLKIVTAKQFKTIQKSKVKSKSHVEGWVCSIWRRRSSDIKRLHFQL